ncbi:MAG: hypothetical protein NWS90_04510 [Algoriphagus sp.]|jgi:hypothetical protein|uniref:hypothetical protein n=2 Tax=Algoriphagus sp. TaxID=1872435 RepID=UPI00274FBE42|nr:hypothetical protein [Algoriphagus sp.]MDP4747234.1 hypothetical protein [Algoriphagus sp.]MDP4839817.1 hypothetical protein [Algoriphagus sp.]MDP4905273.1 hypothetical protein [Algoriphagus sp.]MDP4956352.1 hypothetical protein [Algoriphagus sp.]
MPDFFDDLLKKIFPARGSHQPLSVKENFLLKDKDLQDVEVWGHSEASKVLYDLVYRNYHYKRAQINESPEVHVFSSVYANGFALSYGPPLDVNSFSLLFLGLSRRIIALGYEQVSLDRKLEEVNEQVKETEKFYFKPPLQMPQEGALISQLYGNISLEKIRINQQPSYFKLLAAVYSDRLYHDAKPFDELMDRLFERT